MKIYITGCAKSGTTLLYRLFDYFKNVEILRPNEVKLEKLINTSNNKTTIGKRRYNTILSLDMGLSKLESQRKVILDNDIKIVNVVRDGRDVILSSNYKVSPKRWISCIQQRKIFANIISLEVKYEDLIYHPDQIQEDIAEKFGLVIDYKFSIYPTKLDDKYFVDEYKPIYKPRPINDASIHKDIEAYKKLCKPDQIQPFEQCLKEFNYV